MNIFKRPMFYAAIVCTVASVMSINFINPSIVLCISIVALLFIVFRFKKYRYITVILAIILFVVSLNYENAKIKTVNSYDGQKITGEFLIDTEPVSFDDYNQVTFKTVNSKELPKGVKLLVFDSKKHNNKIGDIVTADLIIKSIDADSEFRFYDYGNGIYATANIKQQSNTQKQDKLYKFFGKIRTYVKNTISKNFGGDSAGLLLAVTTGDKSLLSDDFSLSVKATGISHIIVVSGMHLSIVLMAVFFIIDRLFYNKYIRTILSVFIVVIIAGVCGSTMSIMRAGTMFLISAFAPMFNRERDILSSLLTAVVLVLIITPFAVVNISFLLSVLATLAIVWVLPFYSDLLVKNYKIKSKIIVTILNMALASIFAMVFTLPVTIKTFGYASVVAPIVNIIVTYPITLILVLSCLGLVLYPIPFVEYIGYGFLYLANLCCEAVVFIVNKIANLPITVAILPQSAFWLSIAIIFIIVAYMYFYNYKSKKKEVILCQ